MKNESKQIKKQRAISTPLAYILFPNYREGPRGCSQTLWSNHFCTFAAASAHSQGIQQLLPERDQQAIHPRLQATPTATIPAQGSCHCCSSSLHLFLSCRRNTASPLDWWTFNNSPSPRLLTQVRWRCWMRDDTLWGREEKGRRGRRGGGEGGGVNICWVWPRYQNSKRDESTTCGLAPTQVWVFQCQGQWGLKVLKPAPQSSTRPSRASPAASSSHLPAEHRPQVPAWSCITSQQTPGVKN